MGQNDNNINDTKIDKELEPILKEIHMRVGLHKEYSYDFFMEILKHVYIMGYEDSDIKCREYHCM